MDTVGLRELRQNASDLVRRVEAGEQIEITVAGRASARLVPVPRAAWRPLPRALFEGPADPSWAEDRDAVADDLGDPFAPR
ncbi:type II toxin-antitoxin system Phd/YefM family antitoxin [Nocardioides sp.]|uniref:type II toxin-antitoxin system Phd/YefM family antitoxin n=1 Tax=Nocardioides sp. TaxID=35761 RepID=UPI003515D3AB